MNQITFQQSLSIVVTAYNEQAVLEIFINQLMHYLQAHVKQYEVIIVNDGSNDATPKIMQSLREQYPQWIELVHLEKNSGMGAALEKGFSRAQYEWLTFFPADGQIKPIELNKMFTVLESSKVDCVTTKYKNRKYTLKRKVISWVFHGLTTLILGQDPKNQGIYLLKKSVYQQLKLYSNTFLFNLELPVKVQKAGYILQEVKILLSPRIAGVSKAMQKPRILSTLWQMLLIRSKG
ncbi:glycosyltransferase family 2 protein [bacterium]|nr:glycosyltransferase family 2 protein [bacterium]